MDFFWNVILLQTCAHLSPDPTSHCSNRLRVMTCCPGEALPRIILLCYLNSADFQLRPVISYGPNLDQKRLPGGLFSRRVISGPLVFLKLKFFKYFVNTSTKSYEVTFSWFCLEEFTVVIASHLPHVHLEFFFF